MLKRFINFLIGSWLHWIIPRLTRNNSRWVSVWIATAARIGIDKIPRNIVMPQTLGILKYLNSGFLKNMSWMMTWSEMMLLSKILAEHNISCKWNDSKFLISWSKLITWNVRAEFIFGIKEVNFSCKIIILFSIIFGFSLAIIWYPSVSEPTKFSLKFIKFRIKVQNRRIKDLTWNTFWSFCIGTWWICKQMSADV